MSRSVLPPDVAELVQPMPDDFAPAFEDRGRYVRWGATLTVEGGDPVAVELGYSRAGGKADEIAERENLRISAWQAMEFARLGRRDLLAHCIVGRHKRA